HVGIAYGMGMTAEKVAQQWKISREDQDAFALASHQKAIQAIQSGEYNDEIAPMEVVEHFPKLGSAEMDIRTRTVSVDEGPRADTSLDVLAKLKPAFAAPKDPTGKATGLGSVTAGNSSQMSDGAGALILVSEAILKRFNLKPLARFASFAIKGVPPEIMGIGPKEAIPVALRNAGITLADVGWIELNEAFAAQSLAVVRDLGIDPKVLNPLGGAIARGHPLGATGAIRAATAIHGMRRQGAKYSMVTMCVGTGMGAAGIFENV
ncbi:MAG TPA: acetyl-CoA C-acyltransferase, partial [Burkholderiaceae bacterium]|nr:acetyl-CoA C-acyltransferase [Burkholderiaceae bacterium]